MGVSRGMCRMCVFFYTPEISPRPVLYPVHLPHFLDRNRRTLDRTPNTYLHGPGVLPGRWRLVLDAFPNVVTG